MLEHFDAIIIGFGKGGKTLGGYLAKKGEKVALIERDPAMYGGTCINVGCIPSKTLVKAAEASSKLEPIFSKQAERYRAAIERKESVVTTLRGRNYQKLASFPNVEVINGTAAFSGDHEVSVAGRILTAPKIFINTGSSSFVPPLDGIKDNPKVYFSDSLMALKELPKRLTIIGGGYIGLEFASMYNLFGSKVSVLQVEDSFIPREDRDLADAISLEFTKRGIDLIYSVKITHIDQDGSVSYEAGGKAALLKGDAILVATGRSPNTKDLHGERTGLTLTPRGAVVVDDHLQSVVPGIFAMGDVIGGLQFTCISLDDFRIVKSSLEDPASPKALSARHNAPYSVFISPAFSRVGLSESEAKPKASLIPYLNFRLRPSLKL